MEKGSGVFLWGSAQAAQSGVPIPMCQRGWPRAEDGRGRRAHSSPLSQEGSVGRRLAHGTGAAGQSVAHGQMAESWSCVPLKANSLRGTRDGGICATKAQTQVRGEKPSPAEFCAI